MTFCLEFYRESDLLCCDWSWQVRNKWTMSSKEGSSWYDDGALTKVGREELIKGSGSKKSNPLFL